MVFYCSLGQRFAGLLGSSSRSYVARSCSYHAGGSNVKRRVTLVSGLAIPWHGVSTRCCDHPHVCNAEVLPAGCTTRQSALLTEVSTAQVLKSHPFDRLSAVFQSYCTATGLSSCISAPTGEANIWGLHENATALHSKRNVAIFSPTPSHWEGRAVDKQRQT